jgi:hypothetical protein
VVAAAAAEVAKPPCLIHHIGRRRHRSQRTRQRIGDKIGAAFVFAWADFVSVLRASHHGENCAELFGIWEAESFRNRDKRATAP